MMPNLIKKSWTVPKKQQKLVHVPTYRHLITSSYTILVIELCLIVLYFSLLSWNHSEESRERITDQENHYSRELLLKRIIQDNQLRE